MEDWFRQAKYGLMFHYLYPVSDVQTFQVARFTEQVAEMQPGYILFSLGQNSGHFCSPNPVYDRFTGYEAGERCAKRDLPREIAEALAPHGTRLMLYLPSNAPAEDARAAHGMGASTKIGDGYNWDANETLFERWSAVIEEWAVRYGTHVAGWWFDGWFTENGFIEPSGKRYVAAVKRGNRNAMIALNRNVGYGIRRSSVDENYMAGERNDFRELPPEQSADLPWHIISFLGPGWGEKGVRYTDAYITDYVKTCVARGGVVTMDIAITPDGGLDPAQIAQVKKIRAAVRFDVSETMTEAQGL